MTHREGFYIPDFILNSKNPDLEEKYILNLIHADQLLCWKCRTMIGCDIPVKKLRRMIKKAMDDNLFEV